MSDLDAPLSRPVVLALDTTSRAGSVAVFRGASVAEVFRGDAARSHGERLPGDVGAALARAGLQMSDVDLFAVVTGPGSFTGLRVGIAAIQGLAMACGKKVVPVPALEAFAASPLVPDGRVAVWMDAQRQQVFAALYERHGDRVTPIGEPVSETPDAVIASWTRDGHDVPVLIGDGIDLYPDRVGRAWPSARLIAPAPPLAPIAAAIAARQPHLAVPPHAIVPIYVRKPDAVLARDRPSGQRP